MASECVPAEDDEAVVRLGDSTGWVRLWNRTNPYEGDAYGSETVSFCIAIGTADMTAALHDVMLFHDEPEKFVAELAESFTGWQGVKVWQTPSGDVRIEATFRSRGHVDMTWVLSPQWGKGPWTASVTVEGVHAGEEMRRFAEDMRELLG
jgi:hypothetical protein